MTQENMNVDEEIINEIDEFQLEYDALNESTNDMTEKYQMLLLNSRVDDIAIKVKENCIYKVVRSFTEKKNFNEVMNILHNNNAFFSAIPKAKTAKIVRNLLNIVASVPDSIDVQISLCKDIIKWCEEEKRTFLRQRIDGKLAALYLIKKETNDALKVINKLLSELKKLDDKQMLTEAHLIESRIYHSLQNVPKSKASLTAARSAANCIYVVPLLQAELDEMSGILHCEEVDYATSYSYFLEAYEAYDSNHHINAVKCLQYMVLCKILSNKSAEVPTILSGKFGMKYAGGELTAMSALAKAAKDRSLEAFTKAVDDHANYLKTDDLISHHLEKLYSTMLEGNLLKIIYPYSSVEISHVAKRINLPVDQIERKLSQMILDHRFSGILDQGNGHLIIYEAADEDNNFKQGVEIISNISLVVEALNVRASSNGQPSISKEAVKIPVVASK